MIQYKGDQENKGEMVSLATPTITKGGGIRKSGRANKTRPTIDQKRLKALLESGTDNSEKLMDTVEEMFQPERQVPLVQTQPLIPIDDNCQIPLICTTKTRKVQELVVSKISKTGDPIRGLAGQPPYNIVDQILNQPVNITAGQLFKLLDIAVKQMAFSL